MFPTIINVSCLCPTCGAPDDKWESEARASYWADRNERGGLDLCLRSLDLFVNGSPVFDDVPGCYAVALERAAMREAVEIALIEGD
jgi:hypothetical protein